MATRKRTSRSKTHLTAKRRSPKAIGKGKRAARSAKLDAARATRPSKQANAQTRRVRKEVARKTSKATHPGKKAIKEAGRHTKEVGRQTQRSARRKSAPIVPKILTGKHAKGRPRQKATVATRKRSRKAPSPIRRVVKRVSQSFRTTRSEASKKKRPAGNDRPLRPVLRRRIEAVLRDLRAGRSFEASAHSSGLPEARLRGLLLERKLATEKNGELVPTRRGRARFRFFSDGQIKRPMVTQRTASEIGRFMNAVNEFLPTGDIERLRPFEGQSVTDVTGKRYVFETRPNALYELNAEPEGFEEIYELVV